MIVGILERFNHETQNRPGVHAPPRATKEQNKIVFAMTYQSRLRTDVGNESCSKLPAAYSGPELEGCLSQPVGAGPLA